MAQPQILFVTSPPGHLSVEVSSQEVAAPSERGMTRDASLRLTVVVGAVVVVGAPEWLEEVGPSERVYLCFWVESVEQVSKE